MQKQEKPESVVENKQKNKKKSKNKEKKRLMSLFRGPKAENNFYYKANEEEVNAIKQSLIDVMKDNPCLELHKQKNKFNDNHNESEPQTQYKLSNELIMGLNAIIRAIEKNSVIGLIITDPLAIQLTDNIIELCDKNRIPCVSVDSFDELKSCLNISSLTGMAFKPIISSKDAKLFNFYQTFLNIVNKNCVFNQNISQTVQQNESSVSEDIIALKAIKSEETFDKSLFDVLYTKESGDNYCELVEKHMKQVNNSYNQMDVIATQQSFLPFSHNSELYFPQRERENQIIAKIEVIVDEEIKSVDNSFAESLMEESIEKVGKGVKSCQERQTNTILNYREPQIVRLEPSTSKILKRKQRKIAKKKNSKSFRSK